MHSYATAQNAIYGLEKTEIEFFQPRSGPLLAEPKSTFVLRISFDRWQRKGTSLLESRIDITLQMHPMKSR